MPLGKVSPRALKSTNALASSTVAKASSVDSATCMPTATQAAEAACVGFGALALRGLGLELSRPDDVAYQDSSRLHCLRNLSDQLDVQ